MMDEWQPEQYCTAITDLAVVGDRLWARRGTEPAPFFGVYDLDGNPLFTCSAPELPCCSLVAVSPGVDISPACEADPHDYPVLHILDLAD